MTAKVVTSQAQWRTEPGGWGITMLTNREQAAAESARDLGIEVGQAVARKLFEKKGNHTEVHISEALLAATVALGVEVALAKREDRPFRIV